MTTNKMNLFSFWTFVSMGFILIISVLGEWNLPWGISEMTFEIIMLITLPFILLRTFSGNYIFIRIINSIGLVATLLGALETIFFFFAHYFA